MKKGDKHDMKMNKMPMKKNMPMKKDMKMSGGYDCMKKGK